MKLIASTIVRNEADRYLRPFLDHLLTFVDEVRILDDGSDDAFAEHRWYDDDRVLVLRTSESMFFEHEGRARQGLFEFTLEGEPTHVLAIDADEFVADGAAVRRTCEQSRATAFALNMQEVWNASVDGLAIRQDGGWKEHPVPILYAVPERRNPYKWRIADKAGACNREPIAVTELRQRATRPVADILHFGWANRQDRQARYDRYRNSDSFGHNPRHIESIMWPDDKVRITGRLWPAQLELVAEAISIRAQRSDEPILTVEPEFTVREVPMPDPELNARVTEQVQRDEVIRRVAEASDLPPEILGARPTLEEYALYRRNPDGRWVGVTWDGVVVHG